MLGVEAPFPLTPMSPLASKIAKGASFFLYLLISSGGPNAMYDESVN